MFVCTHVHCKRIQEKSCTNNEPTYFASKYFPILRKSSLLRCPHNISSPALKTTAAARDIVNSAYGKIVRQKFEEEPFRSVACMQREPAIFISTSVFLYHFVMHNEIGTTLIAAVLALRASLIGQSIPN